jgi:hypothetical protein
MTYLSNLPPQAKTHSAVINSAISSHGSACLCGCGRSKKALLANNRKFEASPAVPSFEQSLKNDALTNQDKYHTNIDSLSFAGASKPSVTLDSYILSNIVAQMEANTDFFPKGTNKVVAGNCGKRVMSPKLRKKIFGLDFDGHDQDYTDSTVDIIDYKGSMSFKGVMCCHNVWGCPVCARKVSELRKNGLSDLITAHFQRFGAGTITASLFTVPHGLGDDLVDIKSRLLKALRDMTQSGSFKAFMKKFGYCGISRALEVTFSLSNGFHPHIHVLHFFEKELSLDDQILLWETFFAMWTKSLLKNGFNVPSREAFGCKKIASDKKTIADVSAYFSKVESDVNDDDIMSYLKKHQDVRSVTNAEGRTITGWQTEHEMTKWHLKKAKQDGENYRYSMFDFIRGYSIAKTNGDQETAARFRALWLSYRKAFKSSTQLFTRHKHFKISELELSDEELGEQAPEDNQAKVVYQIPFEIWLMVVYMGARGSLLESARLGGAERVKKSLKIIRDGYDCLPVSSQVLTFTG